MLKKVIGIKSIETLQVNLDTHTCKHASTHVRTHAYLKCTKIVKFRLKICILFKYSNDSEISRYWNWIKKKQRITKKNSKTLLVPLKKLFHQENATLLLSNISYLLTGGNEIVKPKSCNPRGRNRKRKASLYHDCNIAYYKDKTSIVGNSDDKLWKLDSSQNSRLGYV